MAPQLNDLYARADRVQTLFPHIKDADELNRVVTWFGGLKLQSTGIQEILSNPEAVQLSEDDIDDAIESIGYSLRELEDYLIARIDRSPIRHPLLWLREPDPRKPFVEDAQRTISDLWAQVGGIGVRLDEIPDKTERENLKEEVEKIDQALEKLSLAADASEISYARERLNAIKRRLPPGNQFWTMLSPFLGVISLQALIWWSAFKMARDAEIIVGVAGTVFTGVIIAGTLGSLVRIIFRSIGLKYIQYRSYFGLFLIGFVRPILGAVLALAVLLLFNSTLVDVPLGSPNNPPLLPLPSALSKVEGFTFSSKEVFFLFAGFLAGFSDEWVLGLMNRGSQGAAGS